MQSQAWLASALKAPLQIVLQPSTYEERKFGSACEVSGANNVSTDLHSGIRSRVRYMDFCSRMSGDGAREKYFMQEKTGSDELMQKVRQHAAAAFKVTADQARQTATGVWSEAKSATGVLQSLVFEDYIKEKPVQALLTAVGVGIVIGLRIRR